jgi:protein arginine kinase activator
MKKCRRCSKPATLHITEIHDSTVQKIHLCENCASEYLETSAPPDEDEMEALLEEAGLGELEDEQDELTCPNCGITYREFRKQGRLGCPHDYVVFKERLVPLLENIHESTHHAGKFPKRAPDASHKQYELIKMRNDLRIAVEKEDYEAAAQLRDDIRQLEERQSE